MKKLIILIIINLICASLYSKTIIPEEIEVEKYKNEILENIIKTKDKDFFKSCYYYDNYIKKYKLLPDLTDYKIERLKEILESSKNFKINWLNGRIYSSAFIYAKNDSNFAENRLKGVDIAHEKAKVNFYRALKRINIYEDISLLNYFEERGEKNRELFSLIDKAKLFRVEYPDINTIKLTYYIDIYGENSLMGILMSERDIYTEDLKRYMGFNYETEYSGVIIDARGILKSFDGYEVKVKPALFVVIKDDEGRLVFDKNNVNPDIIRMKGMVHYSYDILEDHSERVGSKPLRIVASGTGDRSGSYIVITEIDAKRLLSSEITRKAIKNGKVVVIIDP